MTMAATDSNDLDEFLGVKPAPWWQRYVKWAAIGVGVILLVLLALHFLGGTKKVDYATETVSRGSLSVTVSATGKLAPTNQVDVGSELSGLVTKVVVDVNDRVVASQPLALIDPSRFSDTVNQSKAALNANIAAVELNKATLAQSSAQLARLREVSRLSGGRVPAKTEMEQAIADRDRAIANLRAAQANVVSAQATLSSNVTQLTKTVIRSPVNGVVLARQIEPGATVAASFNTPTLFVIAQDLSRMKLEVAIDEADVGSVKEGQRASFTVDAFPGQVFPAAITRVDVGSNLSAQSTSTTTTTAQVVSYGATLTVANPNQQLRPGMTATADVVTSARNNVLLVPNAALRFKPSDASGTSASSSGLAGAFTPRRPRTGPGSPADAVVRGGSRTVYVKDAYGQPKAIGITTGVTNGTVTEVIAGDLQPGMQVITGQLSGTSAKRQQPAGTGAAGGAGSGQHSGQ
jgi:HlyD family secretion protein